MPEDYQTKSYFMWMIGAIGPVYLVLILGSALLSFILSLVVLFRARGTNAAVAWIFLAPLPVLIGIYGAISKFMGVVSVVTLAEAEIKFHEMVPALEVLFLPWLAMTVSVPTYLVILVGAVLRALQPEEATMLTPEGKTPIA